MWKVAFEPEYQESVARSIKRADVSIPGEVPVIEPLAKLYISKRAGQAETVAIHTKV